LVVSGSRDRTIRLWRVRDGTQAAAALDAGVDVSRVVLSGDQRTVVALADRHGTHKLVMLRTVRAGGGTTSSDGSRCTSPLLSTTPSQSTPEFC